MDAGQPPLVVFTKISSALPHYGIEDIANWSPEKINAVCEALMYDPDKVENEQQEEVVSTDTIRALGGNVIPGKWR